ncbi:hypothetical protein JTB14_028032 [Gonioctena quinquepunctata]|nr:hypothetical protein JTB14_028032 [Gonioctena quinquepunctata]
MDSRLAGIKGVMPYFDDVLIVAESADQLEVELRSVLKRFKEDGLRLRADKCEFFVCQVKFLGFLITKDGLSPTNEKIRAIQEAPAPTSKLELQAFLGIINFFHLFLENKATVAEPLHKSLHKDALSRLPLTSQDIEGPPLQEVLMLESVPEISFTAEEIAKKTKEDRILSKVSLWIQTGWTDDKNKVPEELKQFWQKRNELSMYNGCLLWGNRVIIPSIETNQVLQILHATHPGIVRMKALARSYVWWPGLDADIERLVHGCSVCQENRNMPPKAVLRPWEETREPWTRLHIDFAGPTQGSLFLIVVDSFSKWLEVRVVPSTSFQSAISVLRELFATHGVPLVIVSDNATAFTSSEFQIFLTNNLIRHARIAPYHPASNGEAERMVQTTKHLLKMLKDGDIKTKLARFLMQQHPTPISTTGDSPAEILMNRKLQTRLSSLHPKVLETSKKQTLEKDAPEVLRQFRAKDPVYARNYGNGPKCSRAFIQKSLGPVSYRLDTPEGNVLHRHVDQIRRRQEEIDSSPILAPKR